MFEYLPPSGAENHSSFEMPVLHIYMHIKNIAIILLSAKYVHNFVHMVDTKINYLDVSKYDIGYYLCFRITFLWYHFDVLKLFEHQKVVVLDSIA